MLNEIEQVLQNDLQELEKDLNNELYSYCWFLYYANGFQVSTTVAGSYSWSLNITVPYAAVQKSHI